MSNNRRKLEEMLKLLGMSNADISFLDGYEGSDLASAKTWIESRKANKEFSKLLNVKNAELFRKSIGETPENIEKAKKWIENRNKENGKDSNDGV